MHTLCICKHRWKCWTHACNIPGVKQLLYFFSCSAVCKITINITFGKQILDNLNCFTNSSAVFSRQNTLLSTSGTIFNFLRFLHLTTRNYGTFIFICKLAYMCVCILIIYIHNLRNWKRIQLRSLFAANFHCVQIKISCSVVIVYLLFLVHFVTNSHYILTHAYMYVCEYTFSFLIAHYDDTS